MEKFVYVTDTSSTASGPPSPTGEGFCKPSISATDKGLVRERSDLGSSRTSTPTIDKDRRRMCSDNRYDLGRPVVAPTSEMDVVVFGYRPNKDFYLTLHN